jgi:hypothetical protein
MERYPRAAVELGKIHCRWCITMPKRELGYSAVAEDPENGSSLPQDSPHLNVKLVLYSLVMVRVRSKMWPSALTMCVVSTC